MIYPIMTVLNLHIHERYGQRSAPKYSSFEITENEYRRYLGQFSLALNQVKTYMNEVVFRDGLKFPYDVPEFYTTVEFRPGAMYFIMLVEDEYKTYFETEEEEEFNPYEGYSAGGSYGYDN